jgi:hypothetical protein
VSTLQQNNGSGNFSEFTKTLPFSKRYGANFLDVDKDGDQDLLFTIMSSGQFNNESNKLFLNNETGHYTPTSSSPFPSPRIGEADIADINNDGFPDVIISGTDMSGKYVELYLNNKENRFVRALSTLSITHSGEVKFFDADEDGDMDLIIGSQLYKLSSCTADDCIGPITSISNEDKLQSEDFTLLPNPVSTELEVRFNSQTNSPSVIEIFDQLGKNLVTEKSLSGVSNHTIDMRNFSANIYFIAVRQSGYTVVKKIIKL